MSFKEIRLIRLLIWVLFYLVVVFLLIYFMVIPMVSSYKEVHKNYTDTVAYNFASRKEYEVLSTHLKDLKAKYPKVADFDHVWDEKQFLATAKKYFLHIEMKPLDANETDGHFRVYQVNAVTKMESPQNFYRFLDALEAVPFVVQTDFPITLQTYGEDQIEGIFRIRVFQELEEESNRSNPSVSNR
ncbi:MAG: hypothetical protein DSY46_01740 [Hydrogenimonas sp.]|nr:MAG: hypothetical protein DSY46_01740 [Hydrogenimonas sp.]